MTDYLSLLEEKYSAYFDVEKNKELLDEVFDLFAASHARADKYFLSKSVKIGGYENHEYCLVKEVEALDGEGCSQFIETLREALKVLPEPHPEHMSTVVTGVLVVKGGVSPEVQRIAARFRAEKSYFFKGWSYARLIIVDLQLKKLYTNKRGREVVRFYEP